jgi:hypothetical protein
VSFKVITVVMFQIKVFRVVTPDSVVVGYQRSDVHAAFIFRVKWPGWEKTT